MGKYRRSVDKVHGLEQFRLALSTLQKVMTAWYLPCKYFYLALCTVMAHNFST
jgi:hypothetical protein